MMNIQKKMMLTEFAFGLKKKITSFAALKMNKKGERKMAPVLFLISCVGLYLCCRKMFQILFGVYKDFKKVEHAYHCIKKDYMTAQGF